MTGKLQFYSIIFFGACIVLGCWMISQSLTPTHSDGKMEEPYRYEFIGVNENNIIIFDKQTGEYWRKYIESNEGPTDWRKEESPLPSSK